MTSFTILKQHMIIVVLKKVEKPMFPFFKYVTFHEWLTEVAHFYNITMMYFAFGQG